MTAPLEPRPGCVGASIATASGAYFDFLSPETSVIDPADIGHALAQMCRYTGHTRDFYSIAQHCVLASYIVPEEDAFAALMHDAHEAYVGDMSSPLKQLCPDYRAIEKRVEAAVAARFGLTTPWPASVKQADLVMLMTEKRDLTSARDHEWPGLEHIEPASFTIFPWGPGYATTRWRIRFDALYAQHSAKAVA